MSTIPHAHPVVKDITILFCCATEHPNNAGLSGSPTWHRLEKELHLYTAPRRAWLYLDLADEEELAPDDLLVTDIVVAEMAPNSSSDDVWESRPGGIWVRKAKFRGRIDQYVTAVDVLFGEDAVDPRPRWMLIQSSLRLDGPPETPAARLSVHHGRANSAPDLRPTLKTGKDGKFKIVQISDTHMVTGVGVCKDAVDATGGHLPESAADPLTVKFIGNTLDIEKPDLVVLTGDQLHHDILDTQSALFKVAAPIISRSLPFAAVFGNHDSEGAHALSREAQMSLLRELPLSLCDSGPEHVDGVGNFHLQIMAPECPDLPLSTLFFLDSHGQTPNKMHNPDYCPIEQSQIDWFTSTCQALRSVHEAQDNADKWPLSIVFQHIPLPEFGDCHLRIHNGHRREPSEGPSWNSHFYDALVREQIVALGCGHDHVNDFCALLPNQGICDGQKSAPLGPWLCYGGATGYGGYCSYGGKRFYRRMRVWELEPRMGILRTWKRVEYLAERVDEIMLVEHGKILDPRGTSRNCLVN